MAEFSEEQLDRMPNLKAVFYAAGATDAFCRPLLATENLIARSRFALLLLHQGIKERMNPRPLIADLTRLRDTTGKMYAKKLTAECLEIFLQILFDAPLAACRKILEESSKGIR